MPATIVQSVTVVEATGPNTVAVMPSDVTSGNLLVVMWGNTGSDAATTISDTRGLTFTSIIGSINVNGSQSSCKILTAPITSSGPDTVTRVDLLGNFPCGMWVFEIGGISSPTTDSTNGDTSDAISSVNSGNVVSANTDLILLGCAGSSVAAFDTFSPSGSTTHTVGNNGFLQKFVAAGTYSCTFDKTSTAGGRNSCCAALISFSPASSSVQPSILVIT